VLTVNFVLKNNPNALTLVFKFHKAAEDLYKKALASIGKIEAEDDYGCKLAIDMLSVAAVSMSEYEKDMDKNMDLQIIQHKSQLKAQSKARNDIGLRLLEKDNSPPLKVN
jgi:hypothetical protein